MEFIKFERTPGEKHLGIATVKMYGKIMLRYKIIPSKDGASFFCAPPSATKMVGQDGKDYYPASFVIDSNSENETLQNFIKAHVSLLLSPAPTVDHARAVDAFRAPLDPLKPVSVFAEQPPVQFPLSGGYQFAPTDPNLDFPGAPF